MSIANADELAGMRRAGRVVALALAAMREAVVPGATPADVEAVGADVLRAQGAQAAPVVVYGAPCAAFVSVNDAVVHGLPTRTPLRAGDLVKIDVTPMVDGFVADGAITVAVEPSTSRGRRLARAAEHALAAAPAEVRPGVAVHALGAIIDRYVGRARVRHAASLQWLLEPLAPGPSPWPRGRGLRPRRDGAGASSLGCAGCPAPVGAPSRGRSRNI